MAGRLLPKQLLLSVAVLGLGLLVLGVAELGLRAVGPERCRIAQNAGPTIDQALEFLQPCYRETVVDGVATLEPGDRLNMQSDSEGHGPKLPTLKPTPGVHRVVVIGESSGFLLGQALKNAVRQWPGAKVEILNCGQPGSGLEHVERRFNEVMRYSPDSIVLVFGHNLLFQFPQDEKRLKLARWRTRSCLLSAVSPLPPEVVQSNLKLEDRLVLYDQFLQRASAATKAAGRDFVVTTVAGNMLVAPRIDVYVEAGDRRNLASARLKEAAGDRAGAKALLAAHPFGFNPALSSFLLGEWELEDGETEQGRAHLQAAVETDWWHLRAAPPVNALIRKLSTTLPMKLRDTVQAVESATPQHIPGWESFEDNCHLLPQVRYDEARAILQMLPLNPPATDPALPADLVEDQHRNVPIEHILDGIESLTRQSLSTPDQVLHWFSSLSLATGYWLTASKDTKEHLERFVKKDALATLPAGAARDRFLLAIADGYRRAGMPEDTRRLMALTDETTDARALVERGLLLLRFGETAQAKAAFEKAAKSPGADEELRAYAELMPTAEVKKGP